MRLLIFLFACVAQSAIDINGNTVVEPLDSNDPAPISDPSTYQPDQHSCPLPCVDFANTHSWIPYHSLERLGRCEEPMLLQFSTAHSLTDPTTDILIRSCTLGSVSATDQVTGANGNNVTVENPKLSDNLFDPSIKSAPACAVAGSQVRESFRYSASSQSPSSVSVDAGSILEGIEKYFSIDDNCDESTLFAYYKKTVAGLYIGPGLGKPTVKSVLKALNQRPLTGTSAPNRTAVELCGSHRGPAGSFGIAIDSANNLEWIRSTVIGWSQGGCMNTTLGVSETMRNIEIFSIVGGSLNSTNSTSNITKTSTTSSFVSEKQRRAVCSHIQVVSGDGCGSLASKCGISGADFTKYNPKSNLCSTLQPGDYVCCSSGDPYTAPKPDKPKPGSDGVCATHLIVDGDSCSALASKYGLTVDEIEGFNKGKVWAWTECKNALIGYNMCLSEGTAPLPPPQEGAECGPLVPGTQPPSNKSASIADLNPCPLKACCSNWGFCGPFPEHCDIHAPEGGGPGSKLPGFRSTCVSNCGNEIKKNSGPPSAFQRIGYYESWNFNRECLWLKAKNANTDGSYTHIHWGFLEIDPTSFKPLSDVKKAATYNIIRTAIINNRDTFASNIAKFLNDEGIDGVDIDWEYPGAPDILVGGQPIGQKGDGIAYLKFLTVLKQKVGTKSVSIAAPASYWYLKAFPIDRIASVIDYIVYMTYDLHGQWDYGNVNAFDSCPSGKCIRSHVNLTETRNSLSIITKAGVPNNKIFVGESSYGRSFHMAQDGCWGPMCEFTGSRTHSDAAPGRCTNEGGYISLAEINEIIGKNSGAQLMHDGGSNTDVLLYKGDYISYMTPTTKDTRRGDWKGLNFAGTIDWAVDLQAFTTDDMNAPPKNGAPGTRGCVGGRDINVNTGDLCAFSCSFDFCPESLCECAVEGKIKALPSEVSNTDDIIAWDELDVDLNRLCKFACKHGYCPDNICTHPVVDPDENGLVMVGDPNNPNGFDYDAARQENMKHCLIYKDPRFRDAGVNQCYPVCKPALDQAAKEGRTSNYGCVGSYPLDKPIPWSKYPGTSYDVAPATCSCDNFLVNEIADLIIEAMPIIAQIGCYILMSSLKFVLDVGATFLTGGAGKALDAGLDMAATGAQMASYLYPEEQDPEGAFSWWLSPCGGTDLVPDEIKKVFGILNSIPDGLSSFKKPKKIPKGSGKKGDDGNPTDRSKPKPGTGSGPKGTGGTSNKKKCNIRAGDDYKRMGAAKNTIRRQKCVNDKTQKNEIVITSLEYARGASPLKVVKHCDQAHTQACHHYSSAIRVNPQWATLTCPPEAAITAHEMKRVAPEAWSNQHNGAGWQDESNRREEYCDRDEYPPLYLLNEQHPAYTNAGVNRNGQLIRWVPWNENQDAGKNWRGACFVPPIEKMSDSDFEKAFNAGRNKNLRNKNGITQTLAVATVSSRPEFSFGSWGHSGADRDDGLWDNPCWPNEKTPQDPGFCLFTYDAWYGGRAPPFDYKQAAPGTR
ncbi:glycoside hydrolase family 18 protein [Polyplosphaeria fusca]|uniref:chitinase n=1 Tax=Polyplosphaeria fusca TaxID=682080 RepID=A0A9P4QR50_9PLEO|nr:glycoside hydrolase family 18 protein [Polyplosphaeria fusca]